MSKNIENKKEAIVWNAHVHGDPMPCGPDELVYIRRVDGAVVGPYRARSFTWGGSTGTNKDFNIEAWRHFQPETGEKEVRTTVWSGFTHGDPMPCDPEEPTFVLRVDGKVLGPNPAKYYVWSGDSVTPAFRIKAWRRARAKFLEGAILKIDLSQAPGMPEKKESTPSAVDHPPHYNKSPSGVECIDVAKHMSFCLGNAMKYIWRADHKGAAAEDLEKAIWYINEELRMRREKIGKETYGGKKHER